MALLVHFPIEGARELLHRMNQDLLTLAVHLEALSQGLCLPLNQSFACQDHVTLNLMRVNIDLAGGLIIGLENVLILL